MQVLGNRLGDLDVAAIALVAVGMNGDLAGVGSGGHSRNDELFGTDHN